MKKWTRKKAALCSLVMMLIIILTICSVRQFNELPFSYYEKSQREQKNTIQYVPKEAEPYQQQGQPQRKEMELYARAAALIDADSNQILYEKDAHTTYPMASTTKIMTCIYTLENSNLDDVVTISQNAASQPQVRYGLQEGEQYVLRDLLYALMLESCNDCAVAIAEHVGGSVEQFCQEMTRKAKSIGCYNTSFQTPNGLDAEGHYSTAADMARIGSYAIKNDTFIEITNTQSYTVKEVTKGRSETVQNRNAFLTQYDGAIGIKTGYTSKASYCFVGAVKKGDKTLVSCVLASGWYPKKSYKWVDTKKLMDYGLEFQKVTVAVPSSAFPKKEVVQGRKKKIGVCSKEKVTTLLYPGDKLTYKISWRTKKITAPVKKDAVLGYVTIFINGERYRKISLYSTESCEVFDYQWCGRKIVKQYLAFVLH